MTTIKSNSVNGKWRKLNRATKKSATLNTVKMSIRLSKRTVATLEEYAAESGKDLNTIINDALKARLDLEESLGL